MSNSFCHVHCEGIPWPSSHSQTSNEESMLSDAYPAVELKTTPKMKGVFREKCKVLQYFGKASVFILHLLITVVSFWICSSMKNEIIKLKTNIAFNFLISHFSYPDAFIKIRKQALSFESIHLTFSWPMWVHRTQENPWSHSGNRKKGKNPSRRGKDGEKSQVKDGDYIQR